MLASSIDHESRLRTLMDHPEILSLIGGVIGEDFNCCGGDGNYYTRWHPDGSGSRRKCTTSCSRSSRARPESGNHTDILMRGSTA